MKKFLALLLSLAMILSLSVPAFAADSKNVTANYTPSSTGGEDNAALVIGDNEISDGTTYTYTAEQDGTLYVTVTRLYWGDGGEVYEAYLNDWVAIYINGTAITKFANTVEVSDGDIVTVAMESLDDDSYHGTVNLSWEAPALAEITGVSITVDGEEYTSGTATITPDTESIILTVTGTNLQNGTLDNLVTYTDIDSVPVTQDYFDISDDGTSATYDLSSWKNDFKACTTAHEIWYSNDNQATRINSGIYVIYDDGETTFYDVTVEASENGTVKAPPKSVAGGEINLTVTPDAGYQLGTLTVTAGDGTTINPYKWGDSTYFFYMPEGNVTVTATFVAEDTDDTPAEITGVSITVDGTEYTSGTATITPDTQSIILTVTGTNLQNGTSANFVTYANNGHGIPLTWDGWTISDGTSATCDLSRWKDNFKACTTAFEIQYSNDGQATWIDAGVYVIYDDGTDDTPAEITGVSITVDGTEYTSGQTAVIKQDTQSIILTITGTNLQNDKSANSVTYTSGSRMDALYFSVNSDGTSATYDLSSWKDDFKACTTAFEIQYSNDNCQTRIDAGVYVIYDDSITPIYDVTVTESDNGTVKAAPQAAVGSLIFLTVTPDEGYQLGTLTVLNGNVEVSYSSTVRDNVYSFYMPAGNVTVTATFVPDTTPTYAVTADFDSTRGTITVDKPTAKAGETVTVTFTPDEGYVLVDCYAYERNNSSNVVNLIPGTETNTYTFTMPAHAVLVNGEFAKDGRARADLYFNNGGNTDWTNVWAYFYTDTGSYIDAVSLTMAENGVYTLPEGTQIPNLTYKVYFFVGGGGMAALVDIPTGDENMFTLGTTTNVVGQYEGTWSVYNSSQPPTDVTSADITWGSLAYTYTDEAGAWSNDGSNGAGTVTVKNTGTTNFSAQPIYTAETDYDEIVGQFYDSADAEQYNTMGVALDSEASHTFHLRLFNQPEKAIPAGTKIGTVTIRIIEGNVN